MSLTRREFLHLTGKGVVGCALLSPLTALAARHSRFEAIAFDAFAIFDPRPIFNLAETLFPGKGTELSNAWRTRQFEYQWLRGLAGRYVDFWQTTTDALVFAAKLLNLELTSEKREELMRAYLLLKAWSEVPSALHSLRGGWRPLGLVVQHDSEDARGRNRERRPDGAFRTCPQHRSGPNIQAGSPSVSIGNRRV